MTFKKNAPRPKDIDLIVPGLGVGIGRNKDRFRVSSETREPTVYQSRVAMIRDLAGRLLFHLLRARLEGRFSTTALYHAYRSGDAALTALIESTQDSLLAPLVDRYMVVNQGRDKAKTKKQLTRFIEGCGGARAATTAHLTTTFVAQFLDDLISERHRKGERVSGATRNRYRAAIGGFASFLCRQGLLKVHPIRYNALPKADEGEHRMPDLTADEYRRYFEFVASNSPECLSIFRLLVHTGADVGEVLTRRVRHCDLDRVVPRIRFRRTKTRTRERLVPFPAAFVAELRGHIASNALQPGDLLFGMVKRSTVEHVHQAARKAIARVDLRLKDFRHIAAINWRKAGVELQSIREWLGHATINQTVVYDTFAPDDAYDAPKVAAAATLIAGGSEVLPFRRAG